MEQKLDILAFAAHPDDAELSCSGTLMKQIELGNKVGIVDLTQGELGSRGSKEIRSSEAAEASKIMGIHARENLKLADGFFLNDEVTKLKDDERAYYLLEHVGTKPNVVYQVKVRNTKEA